MIHYHGTPLTPKEQLYKMAGKHFCVSFYNPQDAKLCLEIGQSVMWDNGAFSCYKNKTKLKYKNYYKWLEDKLGHPHWCVIPDVIDGSIAEQKKLLLQFPYPAELSAPVWHIALDLDYLYFLLDRYPKVCFGSSGDYWNVGSIKWSERIDYIFNQLAKKFRHLPYIHMLRGMSLGGSKYPFASADSVNVARNFKDQKKCPESMARKIDAMQTPIFWQETKTQLGLDFEDKT
tara:strand:+ start:902 stop:1594 length:693 start_codon:yes stop_codon:yes gene_type:complete